MNYKTFQIKGESIERKSHPACHRKYYVAELENAILTKKPTSLEELHFNTEKKAQEIGFCNKMHQLIEDVQKFQQEKKQNSENS